MRKLIRKSDQIVVLRQSDKTTIWYRWRNSGLLPWALTIAVVPSLSFALFIGLAGLFQVATGQQPFNGLWLWGIMSVSTGYLLFEITRELVNTTVIEVTHSELRWHETPFGSLTPFRNGYSMPLSDVAYVYVEKGYRNKAITYKLRVVCKTYEVPDVLWSSETSCIKVKVEIDRLLAMKRSTEEQHTLK